MEVESTKVLHLPRIAAARKAENMGVPLESIKRVGGWSNAAVDMSYLAQSLALNCCRALAGFSPNRGHYFISRSTLFPPRSLVDKVFPVSRIVSEIEISKQKLQQGDTEIAGTQFATLIEWLAIVFIQDSCVLLDQVQRTKLGRI